MLTLYHKTGCPYCKKVLATGEQLGLTFTLKNIADEGVMDELIERGGEDQVPYLIDDEGPVEMYESDAIVTYLHHTYGNGEVESGDSAAPSTLGAPDTQTAPGTCTISDE
ncbi:hypothetical protein BH11PAT2_BH11PAT2_03750 [soil metagenome]